MSQSEEKAADLAGSSASEPRISDARGEDAGPEVADSPSDDTVDGLTLELERERDLRLRERAELENFKKRMQREKSEALRFATEALIRDLLPTVDNLERAVVHAQEGGEGESVVEGVRLVLKSALETLARHGVERIEAVGGAFDPSLHEAVAQLPDADREPNQVIGQFLPGYLLHGRLLRPAQVSVSCQPPVENTPDDD